jgi:aspartate racemase
MQGLLGVLGGMGPLATVDFFKKLVEETQAQRDQDHIPVIVHSLPAIPCRSTAIMLEGESPLPLLLEGLVRLKQSNVECIVVPCNTAHFWYGELCKASKVPILHIVDAVRDELERRGARPARLGLMCTESTLATRIYQDRMAGEGIEFFANRPDEREQLVTAAIDLVKQGKPREAGHLAEQAVRLLLDRGVETPVLACTELPVALEAIGSPLIEHCIDASRALARAAVAWSMERRTAVALGSQDLRSRGRCLSE